MTADSGFIARAGEWLTANRTRRDPSAVLAPGRPFSTAVFRALDHDAEAAALAELQKWNLERAEHGFHAIAWPAEYGGLGRSQADARAFAALEAEYDAPAPHELFSVTTRLIAPTVAHFGTDEQRRGLVGAFLRADVLCCQLFSEPNAGSDLAGLSTRAVRDGDDWCITGQKLWSSGAQFAEWGLLIARTDPAAAKHASLTAFLVPMRGDGIEIHPIRQMSGGASFNEVFFDGVRVDDSLRLGAVGDGWNVALTTLGFERDHSDTGDNGQVGGSWEQVVATATALARTRDALVRQRLASLYTAIRIEGFFGRRAAAQRTADTTPGPEGSLGKLLWTERMRAMSDLVSLLVGPALVADTGQWATYAWAEHVLGATGYRIAGGSDEIQRNIIGERVLGLPREPKAHS